MPSPVLLRLCGIIFWAALAGILYTYLGYGLLICILSRLRPNPVRQANFTPSVTVLVAAYNEEDCIAAKIDNSLSLDYPAELLDLAIVADGSTDRTCEIVAAHAGTRVHLLFEPERRGKSAALARAFPLARGEVILFSDANSHLAPDVVRALIRNLADSQVGGASGAKRIVPGKDGTTGQGEGLYWRYEAFLKSCDSTVSSTMGAPGEVWAAKREAYQPPEPDTLLDDFVASMSMVARGWRVIYEPQALASEEASPSLSAEWHRRARNAAGGWQAFFRLRSLWRCRQPLVTFQYLSHRILRWMVTPFLFPTALIANVCLTSSPIHRATLLLQATFYAMALLGWLLVRRDKKRRHMGWMLAPFYICFLNTAALAGGHRYLRGSQSVLWRKVR